MNIYQKLVEVRKSIDGFSKDATGYGYKYVSGTQVLQTIKSKMDELGIVLETHMIGVTIGNSGKGYVISSPAKMIWVNSEKPEDKIIIDWFITGEQKDPSQALGSALTYSERYFLLKFFGIPTDEDDPDKKKPENGNGKTTVTEKTTNSSIDGLLELAYTSEKTRKSFVDNFKGTEEEMKKVLTAKINKELSN